MIVGFFGSWWVNKVQTLQAAYISSTVRQTREECCALNKPGPTTRVLPNEITVGIVAPPTLNFWRTIEACQK